MAFREDLGIRSLQKRSRRRGCNGICVSTEALSFVAAALWFRCQEFGSLTL